MSDHNAGLSEEFVERQRKRLEALRDQLLGAEGSAVADARAFQQEYGQEARDSEDKAQDMEQNEIHQALHDIDKRRLSHIARALQKIEEGSYGLSDLSGEPIPKARLEAVPEAILSVQEELRRESR